MIKLLPLLFLLSCSHKIIEHTPDGDIKTVETPAVLTGFAGRPDLEDVEVEDTDKDLELVTVKSLKGFTQAEAEKFQENLKLLDRVTHSDCFAKYLKDYEGLINNKDQTREELISELRSGKPALNFVMYYSLRSTVGYTYADSDTIWFNRRFHKNFSPAESVANLAHERSHKLGYSHDFYRTARRPSQVPYVVGSASKACVNDADYDLSKRERVRVCYRSWKTLWLKKNCFWKIK